MSPSLTEEQQRMLVAANRADDLEVVVKLYGQPTAFSISTAVILVHLKLMRESTRKGSSLVDDGRAFQITPAGISYLNAAAPL